MKVLISGAGVSGLTLAYWLEQYGFETTIVERAATLPIGGYKIDVRGSGLEVLRKMGIYDTIVAAGTNMQSAILVDKQGTVISEMSGDAFGHRVGDDVEIVRGALCQILIDQVTKTEFIFGDCIQEISQDSQGVNVTFQHHETRKFDLIIGADGIHSNVRKLVFGDEAKFTRELGLSLCVVTLPNYLNLDRVEMQFSELGRVAAVWSAQGEPQMKACFGFTSPISINLRDRNQQHEVLKTVYAGIGWEVPRFLEMIPQASDYYFDTAAQICMKNWAEGRVVLSGDAAYCASPMSGQGTSLAIIGAYVLAGELVSARGNHALAFHHYEKEMRPFVELNQELGLKAARLMRSQENSQWLAWLLNQLMRVAPGRLIQFFIDRATRRIHRVANAISLKEYSC